MRKRHEYRPCPVGQNLIADCDNLRGDNRRKAKRRLAYHRRRCQACSLGKLQKPL